MANHTPNAYTAPMRKTKIKNIVFDIGNVIVRWCPSLITSRTFGTERATPEFSQSIFDHDLWYKLNRGELTANDAKLAYSNEFGFSAQEMDKLFFNITDTQDLIEGTLDLMKQLSRNRYRLFALSDNVNEIVAYLKEKYDFWHYFEGAAISSEIGHLKPSKEIYNFLLDTYSLRAEETVFLDDIQKNVDGAIDVGINAFRFTDIEKAKSDLATLNILT